MAEDNLGKEGVRKALKRPVEALSWVSAVEFCRKASFVRFM
jgi:formylglycine-generating enzyme required for sulfatase activity